MPVKTFLPCQDGRYLPQSGPRADQLAMSQAFQRADIFIFFEHITGLDDGIILFFR
jgi:hypothetical protein